jgi:hypothetical protein
VPLFANGFTSVDARSTKSLATGPSVRFFKVTTLIGHVAMGNSTGSMFSGK